MDSDEQHEYKARKVEDMSEQKFVFAEGKISGYLSCFLGVLSFLAVLCYQFPSYLTTTDLRAAYDSVFLQNILMVCMWIALIFSIITFILGKKRKLGAIGAIFTLAAFALGGYEVETGAVEPNQLSLGLDWLILTLLMSVGIFTFLEKYFQNIKDKRFSGLNGN